MDRNDRITQVTNRILEAFQTGQLAKPLAQVFWNPDTHCARWSTTNQTFVYLWGHEDAATYNQWRAMGRQVRKGERAFYLMRPDRWIFAEREDPDTGEAKRMKVRPVSFDWFPVFGLDQTTPVPNFDGQRYEDLYGDQTAERQAFLRGLPLVEVAEAWGITIRLYPGERSDALGWMRRGQIGLGVHNLSTWAHELVHHAELQLGVLDFSKGQDPGQEVVAELGGAVLLTVLGHETAADWGGAYRYIRGYVGEKDERLVAEIRRYIDRMIAAVGHILAEAELVALPAPSLTILSF